MAEAIKLTEKEQALYDELKSLVAKIHEFYSTQSSDYKTQEECYNEMKQKAHELHMALKKDGHEPKHHAYMYKNRGVPVEDVEFYNHIHPVEDLLAFIENPDANNDPEDSTIGVKFDVRIYTKRWGHYDRYSFTRTNTGWKIQGVSSEAFANKRGNPALFGALDHDFVNYPKHADELLELIWEKAKKGATQEQVQQYLNDFAEWISTCEKTTPSVLYED